MKKIITFLLSFMLCFNLMFATNAGFSVDAASSTQKAIVTANKTSLKSGRNSKYSTLKTLKKDDTVNVIGYKGNWLKVTSNHKTGYILSKYVIITKEETTTSSVTLRTGPGSKYSQISKIGKNQKVYLISKSGNWSKIYYNNQIGYTSSKYLKGKYRICIDAGHQSVGDTTKEPIAPGSSTLKYKTSYGTSGTYTKIAEYKTTLAASKVLRDILQAKGYDVIMVRDINGIKMSNVERAEFANKNNCDLVFRVHTNWAEQSNIKGATIFVPTSNNKYVSSKQYKSICNPSYNLAKSINKNLKADGIKMFGSEIYKTDNLTGFNWSKVPCVLFEMGFVSNKTDDYNVNKTSYQKKFMNAVADGLDAYLK